MDMIGQSSFRHSDDLILFSLRPELKDQYLINAFYLFIKSGWFKDSNVDI